MNSYIKAMKVSKAAAACPTLARQLRLAVQMASGLAALQKHFDLDG